MQLDELNQRTLNATIADGYLESSTYKAQPMDYRLNSVIHTQAAMQIHQLCNMGTHLEDASMNTQCLVLSLWNYEYSMNQPDADLCLC